MNPYDVLAPFYDEAIPVPPGMHGIIRSTIARYRPAAVTVCELGCGTGNILKPLADGYRVVGVDASERMLERARSKVPAARFIHATVDAFQPLEPPDVVLFMFDGLNHLTELSAWEAVFARVHAMLREDGLYLFDIVTPDMLRRRSSQPPLATSFGEHRMIRHFTHRGGTAYDLHITIFEHMRDRDDLRHEVTIPVASFPVGDVRRAMARHFRVRSVLDPRHDRVSERSDRVYIVGQKAGGQGRDLQRAFRLWKLPFLHRRYA